MNIYVDVNDTDEDTSTCYSIMIRILEVENCAVMGMREREKQTQWLLWVQPVLKVSVDVECGGQMR